MSDLDKAIRAALHQHSAALYEACEPSLSPWPDDPDGSTLRFSRTILDLLDWANGLEKDFEGNPSAVGRSFAEQVRTVIATSLGVSGEARSEPTPAPREYRSAGEVPRYLAALLLTRSGAVYGRYHPTNDLWWRKSRDGEPADSRGFTYESPIRLGTLPADEWPLSEVVTPDVPA